MKKFEIPSVSDLGHLNLRLVRRDGNHLLDDQKNSYIKNKDLRGKKKQKDRNIVNDCDMVPPNNDLEQSRSWSH